MDENLSSEEFDKKLLASLHGPNREKIALRILGIIGLKEAIQNINTEFGEVGDMIGSLDGSIINLEILAHLTHLQAERESVPLVLAQRADMMGRIRGILRKRLAETGSSGERLAEKIQLGPDPKD